MAIGSTTMVASSTAHLQLFAFSICVMEMLERYFSVARSYRNLWFGMVKFFFNIRQRVARFLFRCYCEK